MVPTSVSTTPSAALTNNGKGMAGGCPACNLLIARVLDARGDTRASTLVSGINWSANNGADIINLSLSGPSNDSLEKAVNNAAASGAVIVAAAGNKGLTGQPRQRQYPAAYSKVIAISATTENDRLVSTSSRGNWVDLAAPGTNILSTRAGGGYHQVSGTSGTTPFVSTLVGPLASEIRQRMQSTATDLGVAGDDPNFGHGRIDANKVVP